MCISHFMARPTVSLKVQFNPSPTCTELCRKYSGLKYSANLCNRRLKVKLWRHSIVPPACEALPEEWLWIWGVPEVLFVKGLGTVQEGDKAVFSQRMFCSF